MGCFCGFLPLAIFSHKVSSPYEPEATGRLTPPNPPASEGVSIPYEPEATGRLCRSELCSRSSHIKFQAPTNRKPHSDLRYPINSRVPQKSFNSLRTGRHIQTLQMKTQVFVFLTFQFPTNGKAHSDFPTRHYNPKTKQSFNSLRTGRHIQTTGGIEVEKIKRGFNSLRTGRHIQTKNALEIAVSNNAFQFPTNGKAHSDYGPNFVKGSKALKGFNSLRTGRHIQTSGARFDGSRVGVSIPYEREGTFRRHYRCYG